MLSHLCAFYSTRSNAQCDYRSFLAFRQSPGSTSKNVIYFVWSHGAPPPPILMIQQSWRVVLKLCIFRLARSYSPSLRAHRLFGSRLCRLGRPAPGGAQCQVLGPRSARLLPLVRASLPLGASEQHAGPPRPCCQGSRR
eukprot:9053790-Alexandrium_andersonii.AAC.1